MKKKLLPFIALSLSVITNYAQSNPAITSWVLNTNNGTGYNCSGCTPVVHGTILTDIESVYYTGTDAYITTSGVPSYNIGPWKANPNVATDQNKVWKITLNPTKNNGTLTNTPLGTMGIWSNGVGAYNPKDGFAWVNGAFAGGQANATSKVRNAYFYEAVSFDACLGHADAKGSYHNHVNPKCLYDATASTKHSPIIGYALDGFPIYGAYAYTNTNGTGAIKRMTSSYTLPTPTRTDPSVTQVLAGGLLDDYVYGAGSGDLDEHNGRTCITPEYPNGTYAYFVTIEADGTPVYPYVLGPKYYGVVGAGVTAGTATIPGTATKYVPIATALEETETANSIITISPNPALNNKIEFNISTNSNSLNVSVIDYQGRILINKSFAAGTYSNRITLDSENLNSGMYWVNVEYGNMKEVKKVIVKNE